MSDDRYQELAAAYLRQLAKADMKAWRLRQYAVENAQLAEPLDHESAMEMRQLRRVTHQRRDADG
jgi:hypothetical protein